MQPHIAVGLPRGTVVHVSSTPVPCYTGSLVYVNLRHAKVSIAGLGDVRVPHSWLHVTACANCTR